MGYVHLRYVYSVYECPHEVDKCYVLYEGVHIILCLSSHPIGNYYGKGQVRRKELYTSASLLGIRPKHVQIVDDARLPDDPSTQWSLEALEQHISEAIRRHSIQTVSRWTLF